MGFEPVTVYITPEARDILTTRYSHVANKTAHHYILDNFFQI
jgi:hypothetical protein